MIYIYVLVGLLILGFIFFRFGRQQKNRDNEGTLYIREDRGERFEKHVDLNLNGFESVGGKVLSKVADRIDELLILKSGIYVIEFKNYKGRISGNDTDEIWTATYQGNMKEQSFYNPVKQNVENVNFISSVLQGLKVPVYSFIVFSNECSLKDVYNNSDVHIIKEDILIEAIIKLDNSIGRVISDDQIEKIYRILSQETNV